MSSADPPDNTIVDAFDAWNDDNWLHHAAAINGGQDAYDYALAAYAAGAAQAARDERQAIIALIERQIAAQGWGPNSDAVARVLRNLADLLRGAETTGDKQ